MENLKIFGELYANTYDLVYRDKNYRTECDLLEQLFENKKLVKSILDLGCGTGRHATELSKRGYKIVGMDQSSRMIEIAQDKNIPSCEFKLGDIRTLDLNQTFDAVILMFNVIGYLTNDTDLSSFFGSARRHLNKGGLLIFEFWYGPAVRRNPPGETSKSDIYNGLQVHRFTEGKIELDRNCVLIDCNMKHGSTINKETHKVRFFDIKELSFYLEKSGFTNINFSQSANISHIPNSDNWSAVSWSQAE